MKTTNKQSGFAMMEIVIATALISVLTLALVSVTQKSLQLSDRALKQAQASFLLEEGAEAVKTIRDAGWDSISSLTEDANYYLYFSVVDSEWSLSLTPNDVDGTFTRVVVISDAYRDASDDFADSGTADPNSRKVTVTVSWDGSSGQISKTLSFYMVDLFG